MSRKKKKKNKKQIVEVYYPQLDPDLEKDLEICRSKGGGIDQLDEVYERYIRKVNEKDVPGETWVISDNCTIKTN